MQTGTFSATSADTSSDIPCDSHTARLGKIARLPAAIRQTLNQPLEDHEPSQRLVDWLNSLPDGEDLGAEVWWQNNPRGYSDWASPLDPSWTPPAENEAASPDPSSPVKADQGESSLEPSAAEGGDEQTT